MLPVPDTQLFDAVAFDAALAADEAPLPLFRDTLRHARELIKERWLEGRSATELVPLHASVVDELLRRAWRQFFPDDTAALTLVAVGGYGRGELHPASDIDILVLARDEPERHGETISAFLTFLWDIGLEPGSSVRTIEQCVAEAEKDITVATTLQEARHLAGPEELFAEQQRRCGPEYIWPSREFFRAKFEEQQQRHRRYNDTAYNLEPNVKEGPGGLRDIHILAWVLKRHYGVNTLEETVTRGFLTLEEYHTLMAGQTLLWQARFGLHVFSGRREDRLLFDYQRTLASHFGYRDTPRRLAVEQYMKQYYRTVLELSRVTEMLLQLFQEELLYADEAGEPQPVNARFQSRKGFLEARYPKVFEYHPFALLEVFLLMAQHPEFKGVRANTIRLIRAHRHLIDVEFRNDLACRSLFMELIRQPVGVTHELRRMNRYGVLAAYLPVFDNIVGQMQHDLFHVYTVDEHTMFVVRNLRRFTVPEFSHEFPLCSEIIAQVPKQELLVLAGLFHDIAKGRGGDHSELGAEDALEFCQHHLLSDYDSRMVAWLVRNHLLMSHVAQRQDITDPVVVNAFAEKVGEKSRLDYLYLLTVADIRATSPSLWNNWKDSLLRELYFETRQALRRGVENPEALADYIARTRSEARALLEESDISAGQVETLWAKLGDEYFQRCSPAEIAWHTRALLHHDTHDGALVLLDEEPRRGSTELAIFCADRPDLFAALTRMLDQLGLDVVEARIIDTGQDMVVDTFQVLEANGETVSDPRRAQEIRERLREACAQTELEPPRDELPLSRQSKHFRLTTEVRFTPDPAHPRTVMEISTWDRPGLLSRIGYALAQEKVRVVNAKIATYGERARDFFFLTDRKGKPLDEQQQERLRQRLVAMLDEETGPQKDY